MQMQRLFLIASFSLFSLSLFGGTIRLYNDSPYKLRAVIRGADGGYYGELAMDPQGYSSWTDANSQFGIYDKQRQQSVTPYTVIWYCLDGGDYSICTNVATGATVTAQGCEGARECKPKPKRKQVNPNEGKDERLFIPQPPEQQDIEEYPAP